MEKSFEHTSVSIRICFELQRNSESIQMDPTNVESRSSTPCYWSQISGNLYPICPSSTPYRTVRLHIIQLTITKNIGSSFHSNNHNSNDHKVGRDNSVGLTELHHPINDTYQKTKDKGHWKLNGNSLDSLSQTIIYQLYRKFFDPSIRLNIKTSCFASFLTFSYSFLHDQIQTYMIKISQSRLTN